MLHRPGPVLALLVALSVGAGCERNPIQDSEASVDDFPAATLLEGGSAWESAPLPSLDDCDDEEGEAEPWLAFDGRTTLVVEHGLGRVPSLVLAYVAFDERGCKGTLASGDIVRNDGADERHVRIQNATTENFFLRLYLQ